MAIGFPAYHTQIYQFKSPASDHQAIVQAALQALHWPASQKAEKRIEASTSVNWLSWGEKIQIDFINESSVSLTSRCAMPTQCIDWGKNKTNIMKLMTQIQIDDLGEAFHSHPS